MTVNSIEVASDYIGFVVTSYDTGLSSLTTVINPTHLDFGSVKEISSYVRNITVYNPSTSDKEYRVKVDRQPPEGKVYYGDGARVYLDNKGIGEEVKFTLERTGTFKSITDFEYPVTKTIDSVPYSNLVQVNATSHGLSQDNRINIYDNTDFGLMNGEYICLDETTDNFIIKPTFVPAYDINSKIASGPDTVKF